MLLRTLICTLALLGGTAKAVNACVCAGTNLNDRDEAAREFADAAVVFEGEVLPGGREVQAATRNQFGITMAPFRVIRSYKGLHSNWVEIYDSEAGTDCSSGQFPVGEKWFVYGFAGRDGKIYTEACTRTGGLDDAEPDLRYARGEPPTKEDLIPPGEKSRLQSDPSLAKRGATLRGSVRQLHGGYDSNAFITLWELDESGEPDAVGARQKVASNGSFEIRFMPPGRYALTAADGLEFVVDYGKLTLAERQTFSGLDIVLRPRPLGHVRIRVIAPQELHDKISVWLRDAQLDTGIGKPYCYSGTAPLSRNDVATFDQIPRGLYNVDVLLDGDNLNKPTWTHDDVQVQLTRQHAEATVVLRKVVTDK